MCNRDGFHPKRKNVSSVVLQSEDVFFMASELLNCRKWLKGIPELGHLYKQIRVFHEMDIESQKENGYR